MTPLRRMSNKAILLGISGKKRSGKTTFAESLRDTYPNRVHIVSFADALKDEVCQACGITRDFLEQNKADFRLILQGWGTDFRRKHCGDSYWIQRWMQRVGDIIMQTPSPIIVTPDVRFLNERRAVMYIKGMMVRIERPTCDNEDTHASETELDNPKFQWHATIHNDGTLEQFKQQIHQTIKELNIK